MSNYTKGYRDVVTGSTSVDFQAAVNMSPLYRAIPVLYQVWVPCLLLLGGFGNVATIFVLRRMRERGSSQHVFLIPLAVADLACLLFYMLVESIVYSFNVQVWSLHTVLCKLYFFLRTVTYTLSAWLVTAVTIQRTLAITWPHKVRAMCTVRRTWNVVAALVLTSCALGFHFLVMFRVEKNSCYYYKTASYVFYIRYINNWLSMSLTSFLPFVCLLVCDVILSRSLFQASSSTSVSSQSISNVEQGDNSRRETARRTTIMILALSISFLILTLPLHIVVMWYNFTIEQVDRDPKLFALMRLMNRTARLLRFTNSAVNFFLYCFTGTRFRREFLSWISCRARDPSPLSGSTGKISG